MAETLQEQGVPIQSGLKGPNAGRSKRQSQPRQRQSAPQSPRTAPQSPRTAPQSPRTIRQYREYGPTQIADKGTAGIGLLEAEFFGILFLLIITLFAGSASYSDKIMSFMKRGTLTAILFFFLALIAGTGPNAAKVSKALGALMFVAILISTPGQDLVTALDNFFKADWTGTSESGNPSSASADTGTASTSNKAPAPGFAQQLETGIEKVLFDPGFGLSELNNTLKTLITKLKIPIPGL